MAEFCECHNFPARHRHFVFYRAPVRLYARAFFGDTGKVAAHYS
jgi:hypothetical protein